MEHNKSSTKEYRQIMSCILDVGELLLKNGAEVMRVEDTITRLCAAYGFSSSDVLTITSSILLTAVAPDGDIITQTRRIKSRSTDLSLVGRINALSREIAANPMPSDKFTRMLEEAQCDKVYSRRTIFITYGFVSAFFAVFFGGDFADGIASFISGLILYIVQQLGGKLRMNSTLLNTLCSAITAFVIVVLLHIGIGHHSDKIMIGNIMLLIPGLALTTSLRDLINGDTISGLLGLFEAVIKAIAIAIGSALVLQGLGV